MNTGVRVPTTGKVLFLRLAGITGVLVTPLLLDGCSVLEHQIGHHTINLYAADPVFVFQNPGAIRGEASGEAAENGNGTQGETGSQAKNGSPGENGSQGNGGTQSSNAPASSEPMENADGTTAPIYLNDYQMVVCSTAQAVRPPPGKPSAGDPPPANLPANTGNSGGSQSHPQKAPSTGGDVSRQPQAAAPPAAVPGPTGIPTGVIAFGSNPSQGTNNDSCRLENAYDAAIADTSGGIRNRLEAVLVGHSNLICSQIEAKIVGTNDLVNFTLGETTTVLAGSGALVTGATAAKLLAGMAAMTNATRSQVDEIFYENELKAAIIQKINELRATSLQKIRDDSVDSSSGVPVTLDKYSTEDMLNAVQNYHNLCSFYIGITSLTQPQTAASSVDVQALASQVQAAVAAMKGATAKIIAQNGTAPAPPRN